MSGPNKGKKGTRPYGQHEDKELQKTQSELKRAADSPQRDKNKQGGQHGEGQGKTGNQRR
jgi:hypothetical protein